MTMRTVVAAVLVAVACLAGCRKDEKPKETAAAATPAAPAPGGVAMTVARTQVAVGEAIQVTFAAPLNAPAGQQHWITLVPAGDPEGSWGSWHYVPAGAATESVTSLEPGAFEIRLHNYYPHHPYGVIARQRVSFVAR